MSLPLQTPAPWLRLGRTFVHPAFDYLAIGGGLSLFLTALLMLKGPGLGGPALAVSVPVLLFFSNMAHFAASTVRLYSKPGAFERYRFLTMSLPLLTLTVLSLAVWFPEQIGRHLRALYLTWSPFHYGAQAYGLSVMYCYRSGCTPGDSDKRLIRMACMAPFALAFLSYPGSGLEWFVSPLVFTDNPSLHLLRRALITIVELSVMLLPLLPFALLARRGNAMPLISLMVIVSNGIWFVVLGPMDAFVWATIFHGLQYLAITLIFHVREQVSLTSNRHGWAHHAFRFYGLSLLLGYLLFQIWPHAYVVAGFGWAESLLLVTAVINVHHFIVDAYIWRLRRDPNYRIVAAEAAA